MTNIDNKNMQVFDKVQVRVINLERSKKRRQQIVAQLHKKGIPFQIFNAIDGNKDYEKYIDKVDLNCYHNYMGQQFLNGKLGSYFSHITIWQQFIEQSKPFLLVLEDDVVFHDDFIEAIDTAIAISDHWDFLKLNAIRAKVPICQGVAKQYRLNAYLGPSTGLGAYLITQQQAKRFLQYMTTMRYSTDQTIDQFRLCDFRHFGLEPFPSHIEDEGQSTIDGAQFTGVKKFRGWRRFTHLSQRFYWHLHRLVYLFRKGRLFPKKTNLLS